MINSNLQTIVNLYELFMLILFVISIFYLTKIFLKYNINSAIKILAIVGLNFRSITIFILILNNNFKLLDDQKLNILIHLFFIVFFISFAFFSYSLCEIFPKGMNRKLTFIPVIMFIILSTIAFVDLLLPNFNFYFFNISIDSAGFYSSTMDNSVIVIRSIGAIFLLYTIISLLLFYTRVPSLLISWEYSKYLLVVIILTLFSFDVVILDDLLSVLFQNIDFINDIIYMILSLTITSLIIVILRNCTKNTYFNIFFGKDIRLAIKEGIIGYILASMTMQGPTPLFISESFKNYSKITDNTLLGMSITSIVNVGAFREDSTEKFRETISIAPVPNNPNLSSVILSFNTKDPEYEKLDSRAEAGVATVLIIPFPSDLLVALHKFPDILPILKQELDINNNLKRFTDKSFLELLTFKIINELIY